MNEQADQPAPREPVEPVALPSATPEAPAHQTSAPPRAHAAPAWTRSDSLPLLCGVGFVILAAAILYVWQNPALPPSVADAGPALQAANSRMAELDARLKQLEARPVPPPAASPADVQKLAARVDILETRQNADPAQVAQRLDVMSGRIEGITARLATGQDQEKAQFDALNARVSALEKIANTSTAMANRLEKVARLQDAAIALSSGKPLGDLPGAPPALAKFAHQAPPTQAQLRMQFPAAAQAAMAAEQPNLTNAPFVDRVLEKAQALVTVKRGDDVVVGNQTAVILGTARSALDAGDLAGAVESLSHLADAPKNAMADWLAQAQSLLDARTALASMAGQA